MGFDDPDQGQSDSVGVRKHSQHKPCIQQSHGELVQERVLPAVNALAALALQT